MNMFSEHGSDQVGNSLSLLRRRDQRLRESWKRSRSLKRHGIGISGRVWQSQKTRLMGIYSTPMGNQQKAGIKSWRT